MMNSALIIATFLYFLGMVKYMIYIAINRKLIFVLATSMIFFGFIAETIGLVLRSIETGHGPYVEPFEYALFLAWATFAVFLIAVGIFRIKSLGAFMAPLGFLMMMIAFVHAGPVAQKPEVREFWLTLHRTLSSLSFGAFTLICAAGVMYLLQEWQLKSKKFGKWYHRLPSLSVLDKANHAGLLVGFPVLSIGIVAASLYSKQHYNKLMELDFSSVALLCAWAMYLVAIAGRSLFGWQGRQPAIWGIAGFGVIMVSLAMHVG